MVRCYCYCATDQVTNCNGIYCPPFELQLRWLPYSHLMVSQSPTPPLPLPFIQVVLWSPAVGDCHAGSDTLPVVESTGTHLPTERRAEAAQAKKLPRLFVSPALATCCLVWCPMHCWPRVHHHLSSPLPPLLPLTTDTQSCAVAGCRRLRIDPNLFS